MRWFFYDPSPLHDMGKGGHNHLENKVRLPNYWEIYMTKAIRGCDISDTKK